ncbi:ABC transporter permease [Marinivivus vitaminiproducens]|uniref:ABC transporter permease n=1 Tax=Marinivivus vitaminiproducens TaxID=3035935 RepID=UPI0027A6675A|nr:ABC transporter permease [Geminicoccaceae bacterium SCSIO 64248]
MPRLLIRRVIQAIPVVLIVSAVVFSIAVALPGDPTLIILGENAPEPARQQIRQELGLDKPIPVQFINWLGNAAIGDLGKSYKTGEPVVSVLLARVPVTLELAALALIYSIAIGVPLGMIAALKRNTWIDTLVSVFSVSALAMPFFWIGILLIMVFTLRLHVLPPSGIVSFWQDPVENLRHMIMPVLTLGSAYVALVARQTRAAMIQVLSADYVRTARAKGASELRVVTVHAFRNALVAVVTVVGLQFAGMMGGAVVTETVFQLPGLGRMITNAIFDRDYGLLQGGILVVVCCVIIVNLVTDLAYNVLDPRVQQ